MQCLRAAEAESRCSAVWLGKEKKQRVQDKLWMCDQSASLFSPVWIDVGAVVIVICAQKLGKAAETEPMGVGQPLEGELSYSGDGWWLPAKSRFGGSTKAIVLLILLLLLLLLLL